MKSNGILENKNFDENTGKIIHRFRINKTDNKMWSTAVRRITNGNSFGRCSRPRVPENSSRAYALCAVFFHHILSVAGIVLQFLYRNRQNVSYL